MLIISPEILYNIRKKELEETMQTIYHRLQRWTPSAIECYERGCICVNCPMKKFITSQKCQMKSSVIELVRLYGIPNKTAQN